MLALQIIRNPKQVEPPNRIRRELPCRKRPGLLVPHELCPFDLPTRNNRIALNVLKFIRCTTPMLFRSSIKNQPQYHPPKSQRSCQKKSPFPPEVYRNPGHHQRSDNRSNVCPGIENSCRQRAFFFGEPFCNALDARWEYSRFPKS